MSIKVAVIGLGKMGLSHLSIVNALADFEVTAVCDSSRLVTSVLSDVTGLRSFTSYDEVLTLPDLDAVIIATPTASHEPMVRKALARGLHVFAEKPLTLDAQASRELAQLAADHKVIAQVGYHNRFIGTFAEVARLLRDGALGRISHVMAESYGPVVLRRTKPTWRGKAGQGGGCLHDYAAHPINLLNWYFGMPRACLGASVKRGYSAEVEDEIYALFSLVGGATATVSVNWSDPSVRKMTTRLSIWGEGGKLYADRQELQLFLTGNSPVPPGYEEGWNMRYITELTEPVSFYLRGEEYSAQLEAFGRAMRGAGDAARNGFDSAAETDATIALIQAATRGGRAQEEGAAIPAPRHRSLIGRVLGR